MVGRQLAGLAGPDWTKPCLIRPAPVVGRGGAHPSSRAGNTAAGLDRYTDQMSALTIDL